MVLMVLSLCLLIKYNLASCLTKIPASKEFRVKSLDNCMNFLLHLQIMRVLGPTKHTLNGFVMQLQKLGIEKFQFSSVQSLSHIQLLATSWTAARQASLSITNPWSLLKLSPLSWWCHPTVSSSVVSFSSCLQSFPASGSLLMSQLFTTGGQSIGASVLVSSEYMPTSGIAGSYAGFIPSF